MGSLVMKRALVIAALAVSAMSGVASAAPCDTMIMQEIPFGPNTPNFRQTLTFDKYAGPASDICSIQVFMNLQISDGFLVVDNDGALPALAAAKLGAEGDISSMDVPLLDAGLQPVTSPVQVATMQIFNLGPDNGDGSLPMFPPDPAGPDGGLMLGQPGAGSDNGFISPALFAPYAGGGTFNVLVDVDQVIDFGGIGGVEGSFGSVIAQGSVKVIYIVPEPATMSLLGLGALGLLRRIRR